MICLFVMLPRGSHIVYRLSGIQSSPSHDTRCANNRLFDTVVKPTSITVFYTVARGCRFFSSPGATKTISSKMLCELKASIRKSRIYLPFISSIASAMLIIPRDRSEEKILMARDCCASRVFQHYLLANLLKFAHEFHGVYGFLKDIHLPVQMRPC